MEATKLGVSEIGFTPLVDMKDEYTRFESWIDKGYQADMGWIKRNGNARRDPRTIIDSDKGTAIVCLISYNTGRYYTEKYSQNRTGKIAQYAWGRDYHDVVPKLLKKIISSVESTLEIKIPNRVYSDTGPILERDLALKSGVGWRGKNSLILNKKHGSYTFIGVILTPLELEEDKPVLDRCGTCDLCMKACPTQAITQPFVVDSNKCISYLTIESPDELEIKSDLDDWAYGCDVCQQVCPYNNQRNTLSPIESFYQLKFGSEIHPQKILEMTEEEYNTKKIMSPIKRAGLIGLKRNAKTIIEQNEEEILDKKE